MGELSRCGRIYIGFDAAYKAAVLRGEKGAGPLEIVSCDLHALIPDAWHVRKAKGKKATTRVKRYRPDPFPPPVQKLIDKRDQGECQGCAAVRPLERHHRRLKGMGGSGARSHTQCPCNGISLCRKCHEWAHLNPGKAREFGLIVPQQNARPGLAAVTRWVLASPEHFAAEDYFATCDGRWVDCQAETED